MNLGDVVRVKGRTGMRFIVVEIHKDFILAQPLGYDGYMLGINNLIINTNLITLE